MVPPDLPNTEREPPELRKLMDDANRSLSCDFLMQFDDVSGVDVMVDPAGLL